MLSDFDGVGIEYVDTRSLGLRGNLLMAQQLAKREFVLLLHDDDMLHPQYIENALKILNEKPEVNLLTCRTEPWAVKTEPVQLPAIVARGHFFKQKEYATFVYNSGHPSFSLAIYRSRSFCEVTIGEIFERFGKWSDVPLMIEIIGGGRAAFIDGACGWMGLHAGQDTNDASNRPPYRSWIERELYFLKLLGDDPRHLSGLSFCIMNYRHLKSGYKRRISQVVSLQEFLTEARLAGALTPRGEWFRWISFRCVQKALEYYVRWHFHQMAGPLT